MVEKNEKAPYYMAYDNRYKQVHEKNLLWGGKLPTPEVERFIKEHTYDKDNKMLELGCGEGRDSIYLLEKGYNVMAVDSSEEAIRCCNSLTHNKYKDSFKCVDVVKEGLNKKFDFIFSICVIHMLVEDDDRKDFYRFIKNHLTNRGRTLVLSMGDGETEMQSDIDKAFDNTERTHADTNQNLCIANTSCRMVSEKKLIKELEDSGLTVVKASIVTDTPGFNSCIAIEAEYIDLEPDFRHNSIL